MFSVLLAFHSLTRWLLLAGLFYSVFSGYRGMRQNRPYRRPDNLVRHWTATLAHIQLLFGAFVYGKSAIVSMFFRGYRSSSDNTGPLFFGVIHIGLMFGAIVLISIGSAKAKREQTAKKKFRIVFTWYAIALLLILVAIPWPFSPLAQRPYFRAFN